MTRTNTHRRLKRVLVLRRGGQAQVDVPGKGGCVRWSRAVFAPHSMVYTLITSIGTTLGKGELAVLGALARNGDYRRTAGTPADALLPEGLRARVPSSRLSAMTASHVRRAASCPW